MANCEKLIPIIVRWEAGVDPAKEENQGLTYRELFEKAKKKGYSNDPADRGGATMVGITIATYTTYRKRKKKASPSVALRPFHSMNGLTS